MSKQKEIAVFREIKVGEYVLRFWPSDNGWMCGITPEMMQALQEPQEKYTYGTPLLDAMTGKQPAPPPECQTDAEKTAFAFGWWKALEHVRQKPAQQEPVSLKSLAQKVGINLPETYIPTMDDAIAAGDSVLINEQAALLRECRAALDSLIAQKPTLAGLLCGSTTLGNLKAELGAYRPKGVLGTPPASKQWVGLTDEEKSDIWCVVTNRDFVTEDTHVYADAIEAKLKEKNNG